ncbi:MAG: N-acetylmuramic acid 6-phosphate etherase [Granulosicoccus sp.]
MAASTLEPTETIDRSLLDLDLRNNDDIISTLLDSQQRAVNAVRQAQTQLDGAVVAAASRLSEAGGRLVLVGAGASGRIAVQDGAELWPTFSWPNERLLCVMAGGDEALVNSIEGVEDDAVAAAEQVTSYSINRRDVVVCVAASGKSPWTCHWLEASRQCGALGIGIANNAKTPLLTSAQFPVFLDTGPEVLAGSTRMAAGTAQKIALNVFSTTLMIRMNRTYGNLMVDMGAVNAKLDKRRIRMLQAVLPDVGDQQAGNCLSRASGWVKLAVLVARGDSADTGQRRLEKYHGSLRAALASISEPTNGEYNHSEHTDSEHTHSEHTHSEHTNSPD